MFSNDPILKNSHFVYEMSREEIFENQYRKAQRLYQTRIEEITYKNIFYYIPLIGTVRVFIIKFK